MREVEKVVVAPGRLLAYMRELLRRYGLPEDGTETVAQNLLFANLRRWSGRTMPLR